MDQVVLQNDFNMVAFFQSTGSTIYLFGLKTLNAFFWKQENREMTSSAMQIWLFPLD